MDKSSRLTRSIWKPGLLAALTLFLFSCGAGETRSSAVDVKSAKWRENNVLVSGGWAKGIATPPLCRIIESRDGPPSLYFDSDARVVLDGDTFSKEFVPAKTTRKALSPEKLDSYFVRCSVSLDSGKSADDVTKVKGSS